MDNSSLTNTDSVAAHEAAKKTFKIQVYHGRYASETIQGTDIIWFSGNRLQFWNLDGKSVTVSSSWPIIVTEN